MQAARSVSKLNCYYFQQISADYLFAILHFQEQAFFFLYFYWRGSLIVSCSQFLAGRADGRSMSISCRFR